MTIMAPIARSATKENPEQYSTWPATSSQTPVHSRGKFLVAAIGGALLYSCLESLCRDSQWLSGLKVDAPLPGRLDTSLACRVSPYGCFPQANDPFHFMPCTKTSVLPALDDTSPAETWADLFNPNPSQWNWGSSGSVNIIDPDDPYSGRGIYLCGYLETPLDYTNHSDERIVRLAVTKYQVSGLARTASVATTSNAGTKSDRTIILEPGGPGGSGVAYAWRSAEQQSARFSAGLYDVMGWDPRGVNASLPAASCFPYDADRDRWALSTWQYREVTPVAMAQLLYTDAMMEATLHACWQVLGDFGRFVTTAFVARDLEEIRQALGEAELTGYLVS